jgi:threonine/homoserine/homoserine lactone efflux protein
LEGGGIVLASLYRMSEASWHAACVDAARHQRCIIVVWLASALSRCFRERASIEWWLKLTVVALFIGLGAKPALDKA